jgi:hypothetical protein
MTIRLLKLVLLLGGLLGLTAVANAQSDRVNVHVPFTFEAGGKTLPAGDYRVGKGEAPSVLYIEGAENSAAILSGVAEAQTLAKGPALLFNRQGSALVLSAVRFGEDEIRIIYPSQGQPKHAALKSATLASPVVH